MLSYICILTIKDFFCSSVKAKWEPTTLCFTGKYFFMDKFQHDLRGAQFFHQPHPHLCVLYRAWLIATFFTVTACSKGGRVSWTIRSIWIRSVVLLKYVKGFPSLCCGYFKTRGTLGHKSRQIILSTSDSGANGKETKSESAEKGGFYSGLLLLFHYRRC